MLFSALLAVGIHACLLRADLGWMARRSPFTPEPRRVILTLVSRPAPEAVPATTPLKPLPLPVPEPEPETKASLSPPPEPEPEAKKSLSPPPLPAPKPEPIPKAEPDPRAEPEPIPLPAPQMETAPPDPEMNTPASVAPESRPVPASPTVPIPAAQPADIPAALPAPESKPQTAAKTDNRGTAGSAEPVEAPPPEPVVREARPRYRDNPPPLYPVPARRRGHQGTVVLEVFIDKNGRVADTRIFISSGHAALDRAARKTVENWRFEPGMRGAEKIEMWVKVPIRFELQ